MGSEVAAMDAGSFAARRPNASNLPRFELPPPPLTGMHQKYQEARLHNYTAQGPTSTSLTSVGNLLTPPSAGSTDSFPTSSGISPNGLVSPSPFTPFTPNSSGLWPPPHNNINQAFGYPSSQSLQSYGAQAQRDLFSPSLNSIVRGNHSPAAPAGAPLPYDMARYSASAPPQQQHMMGQPTPVMPSPLQQDAFNRQSSTYFSANPSAAAQRYPGSQSPMSTGAPMRPGMPASMPSMTQAQQFARPYGYPMHGAVMPVQSPGGMPMFGGMAPGMMPFQGAHSMPMQQFYGHPHQQSPSNDRPFRCDQCPQSFNRNHDLKRHKRIHLAVKPFPCGHCDKSFSRKDALKRHILVKGCGKGNGAANVIVTEILDGSISPGSSKSGSGRDSPHNAQLGS